MKLHHFFLEESDRSKVGADAVGHDIALPDSDLTHQLKNVFRLRQGDRIVLLDNSGFQYVAAIVSLGRDQGVFHIEDCQKNKNTLEHLPVKVTLFLSLIKKDNVEWIVQKATELGVASFVPILSERSEKKALNYDRLGKIIKEASEQSKRGVMPRLHEVISFSEALDWSEDWSEDWSDASDMKTGMTRIAFDQSGQLLQKSKIFNRIDGEQKQLGIFIGPEGGWSEDELSSFRNKNVSIYSLGPQVLRAETAAISAAGLFLLG